LKRLLAVNAELTALFKCIAIPLNRRYSGADYFYHKNHQGSVTEAMNSSGSIVKSYKYHAFGNILQETGPTIPGGFTYTGRELHARSGLYYYRARWNDPKIPVAGPLAGADFSRKIPAVESVLLTLEILNFPLTPTLSLREP
jgi:hypothetical protein